MAVFVVSAGYGALLPVLPGWVLSMSPEASSVEIARHVGLLSGVYALGVLIGAPLWGAISDHVGRNVILMIGFIGYVASLVGLLVPGAAGIWSLYALRGSTGFFVAAIVPLVSVIVAEGTIEAQRARRFAWLGSMSLLGFLAGPAMIAVAAWLASWSGAGELAPALIARIAILATAALGGVMMIGLSRVLHTRRAVGQPKQPRGADSTHLRSLALWGLSAGVMFVLAAFELGILLQGWRNPELTAHDVALMFAECGLVMLAVNALLFFTSILNASSARRLMIGGLLLAMTGLAVLAVQPVHGWMYLGVSLTAAGTGLVLPVVSYLAAGGSRAELGVTLGGLAAAASLGQMLGSAGGGWLFGTYSQHGFGWLVWPLALMSAHLLFRRNWPTNMKSTLNINIPDRLAA
jgi:MFS family permease